MRFVDQRAIRMVVALCSLVLFALCIRGFYATGEAHGGYTILCLGPISLAKGELLFDAWYALWGSFAVGFGAFSLYRLGVGARVLKCLEQTAERPRFAIWVVGLTVTSLALMTRMWVLRSEPVADDELTYDLIMRTLLHGRLSNPPPIDPDFLVNEFVIATPQGWYGKYPIGHPLILAVFELVGLHDLATPVLGLFSTLLTFSIGRRLVGSPRALAGTLLLAVSPHFIWTHATRLSQPTSTLFTLLAVWLMLRFDETRALRWIAAAGFAWGYCVLVRPLPSLFFIAVAGFWYLGKAWAERRGTRRASIEVAAAALGLVVTALAMGLINAAQTGSAVLTAYQTAHPEGIHLLSNTQGNIAASIAGALMRQNFWLLGWPLSLLFVPFARPRFGWLFWGLILAEYAYRYVVPKTMVAVTGPIYVTEIVPLLCIATADGAVRVSGLLDKLDVAQAKAWLCSIAATSSLVALACFVPVNLRTLIIGADLRAGVEERLTKQYGDKLLVFAHALVVREQWRTWAYYAPNPSPNLDDDVLYLRLPLGKDGPRRAWQLWRDRFPDRPAVVFAPSAEGDRVHVLSAGSAPQGL